jgi:CNT family concentrative nucleoside transporter
MFLLGVSWDEAGTAGGLFGTSLVLNEFVAFVIPAKAGTSGRQRHRAFHPMRPRLSPG